MSENHDDNWASFKKEQFDIEVLRGLEKAKGRDKQSDRILELLGVKDEKEALATKQNLAIYLQYLKSNLKLPCKVTGIEDLGCFGWEEYYTIGPGEKNEYEKLKKENPSFRDEYDLLKIHDEIDEAAGILVKVKRISDSKEFTLPLVDLKAVETESKNSQILDDYSVWHVNY